MCAPCLSFPSIGGERWKVPEGARGAGMEVEEDPAPCAGHTDLSPPGIRVCWKSGTEQGLCQVLVFPLLLEQSYPRLGG